MANTRRTGHGADLRQAALIVGVGAVLANALGSADASDERSPGTGPMSCVVAPRWAVG